MMLLLSIRIRKLHVGTLHVMKNWTTSIQPICQQNTTKKRSPSPEKSEKRTRSVLTSHIPIRLGINMIDKNRAYLMHSVIIKHLG